MRTRETCRTGTRDGRTHVAVHLTVGSGIPLCLTPSVRVTAQANLAVPGTAPIVSSHPALQTITTRGLDQRLGGPYEANLGNKLYYNDAQGNHLSRGELIDKSGQRNLAPKCLDKLVAIDFETLTLQDAIVVKSGTGQRRTAVFANCKKLERESQTHTT